MATIVHKTPKGVVASRSPESVQKMVREYDVFREKVDKGLKIWGQISLFAVLVTAIATFFIAISINDSSRSFIDKYLNSAYYMVMPLISLASYLFFVFIWRLFGIIFGRQGCVFGNSI